MTYEAHIKSEPRGQGARAANDDTARRPPLVVDLDGTLLNTDLLVEGLVTAFFKRPLGLLFALRLIFKGRAVFKRRVAELVDLDTASMPANEDFVRYLEAEHASGREIHLYTAAHQGLAERVAVRFGVFSSVVGSSGEVNLKARRKRDAAQERFPGGFVYAGDSAADLAVWEAADGAVFVGASDAVKRRARDGGTVVEAEFEREQGGARAWLKAMRLHQWAKNLLVFVPLLLSHQYFNLQAVVLCVAAFFIFSVAASGTYMLNDLSDLSADRRHHKKHKRPFAAGKLNLLAGLGVAIAVIVGALGAAYLVGAGFLFALAAYLVVTLSYSFGLKRVPVLDVAMLAGLFTLRLVMGTEAIGAPYSEWLLTFSMFFFLSLSLAKRYVEVAAKPAKSGETIAGRGYRGEDANFVASAGVSAGVAAMLIIVLFLRDDAFMVDVYTREGFLWGVPIAMTLFLGRIWLLAGRRELNDDPVAFAVKDRISYGIGALLAACFAAAVMLPGG